MYSLIENLDEIDLTLLEDLERRLAIAEQELKDANLEERTLNLKRERVKQSQWIHKYEDEIQQLILDVDNVEQIKLAIPNRCFNSPKLEP